MNIDIEYELKQLEKKKISLEKEKNIIDNKYNTLKRLLELYRNNNLPIDVSNVSIGDEVIIPHDIYGDIPFIIIGINHDTNNSVTLLSKNIVRCLAFSTIAFNNRYKYSNILHWMNSDKRGGLLKGFSSDIINQMIEVPKRTSVYTGRYEDISSKIFLLSRTEVGLGNENDIEEGNTYDYFSQNNTDERRITYHSKYAVNNSVYNGSSFNTTNEWHWWLRTPDCSCASSACIVNSSGALDYYYADIGNIGVRFALVLKTTM